MAYDSTTIGTGGPLASNSPIIQSLGQLGANIGTPQGALNLVGTSLSFNGAPIGGTPPGGTTGDIQWNNAGVFAGGGVLTWDPIGATLSVGTGGTVQASTFYGDGTNITMVNGAGQPLYLQSSGSVRILSGTGPSNNHILLTPTEITITGLLGLSVYTTTTLPSATATFQIIGVSDANTGVGTIAFWNGTNWIDIKTGVTVTV